jgi:hypothetical protein
MMRIPILLPSSLSLDRKIQSLLCTTHPRLPWQHSPNPHRTPALSAPLPAIGRSSLPPTLCLHHELAIHGYRRPPHWRAHPPLMCHCRTHSLRLCPGSIPHPQPLFILPPVRAMSFPIPNPTMRRCCKPRARAVA